MKSTKQQAIDRHNQNLNDVRTALREIGGNRIGDFSETVKGYGVNFCERWVVPQGQYGAQLLCITGMCPRSDNDSWLPSFQVMLALDDKNEMPTLLELIRALQPAKPIRVYD